MIAKRIVGVLLAFVLCFCLAGSVLAAASPAGKLVSRITIAIPGVDGLQLTLTNVFEMGQYEKGSRPLTLSIVEDKSTSFSFNKDVFAFLDNLDAGGKLAKFTGGKVYSVYEQWRGLYHFIPEAAYNKRVDIIEAFVASYLCFDLVPKDYIGYKGLPDVVSIYDFEIKSATGSATPPAPAVTLENGIAFPAKAATTARISVYSSNTLKGKAVTRIAKGGDFTITGIEGSVFKVEISQVNSEPAQGYVAMKNVSCAFGAPIEAAVKAKANVYTLQSNGKYKRAGSYNKGTKLFVEGVSGKYLKVSGKDVSYYIEPKYVKFA